MEPFNIFAILAILALAVVVVLVLRRCMRASHHPAGADDPPVARPASPAAPMSAEDEEYLDSSHIISRPSPQHHDKPR